MRVEAMRSQIPKPWLAAGIATMAGPAFPLAIPGGEIDTVEDRCAETILQLFLGCPSIYPDFRYRLVLLQERCANFDGFPSFREFEAQTPAAGRRIWLGDDVLDLGLFCRHNAAQALRVDRFQPVPDHVQHKNRGVVASGADAGPGKSRQRRLLRGVRSPVQAIGVGMLALCLQNGLGLPEACNVVVDFFLGRNFDQLDRTLAPVSDRLRPQTWPPFEAGFEVLIGGKILLTLHQPEAAWIEVGEGADLEISRIMKRPPKLLAAAVEYGEPVGIVYRRPEILDVLAVVRAEKEHACHWCETGVLQIYSRIDRHFHVENRGVAGPDGESIGRRRAFAVEQGVDHDGVGVGCRLLDPERLERRKFLALGLPGVDRKTSGRKTVQFALGDSPEIARTEKNTNLVVIVGLVDRSVKPKAGKAEIGACAWRRQIAEREKFRLVGNFRRLAALHLVDIYSVAVEKPAMKELCLERQLFAAPERTFRQKANRAVAVVIQVLQIIRQFVVGNLERFAGQIARHLPHNGSVKRHRLRAGRGHEPGRRDRYQRQGGSCK